MSTFLKSYSVSLFLHGTVLAALYLFPMAANRRFSQRGQTQVISLQATQSQTPSETAVQVETESVPTPISGKAEADFRTIDEPLERDRKVVLELLASSDLAELPRAEPPPSPDVTERSLVSRVMRRKTTTDQPVVDSRPVEQRQRKPVTTNLQAAALSAPTVQTVGTKDTKAVDLSNNRPPDYPPSAVQQRLEGTVLLQLQIDRFGDVVKVNVLSSSGHEVLDRAAVDAVSKWKGAPAERMGYPIESTERLPIRFRL